MPLLVRNYQQSYQPSVNNGRLLVRDGALIARAMFDMTLSVAANSVSGSFPYIDYDEDDDPFIAYESDTIATSAESHTWQYSHFPEQDLSAPSCVKPELVNDSPINLGDWESTNSASLSTRFRFGYPSTSTIDRGIHLFAPYWGTLDGAMPTLGGMTCIAQEGYWSLFTTARYTPPYGSAGYAWYGVWLYSAQPTHDMGAGLVFPLSTMQMAFYTTYPRRTLTREQEMLIAAVESSVPGIMRGSGAAITITASNIRVY